MTEGVTSYTLLFEVLYSQTVRSGEGLLMSQSRISRKGGEEEEDLHMHLRDGLLYSRPLSRSSKRWELSVLVQADSTKLFNSIVRHSDERLKPPRDSLAKLWGKRKKEMFWIQWPEYLTNSHDKPIEGALVDLDV